MLLAPAALQPLKRGGAPPVAFADRLAMVRLMCEASGDRRLAGSEVDAARADGSPNYTWDTLARLRETLGGPAELFLLIGADAFLTLHQWHRAAELMLAVDWIVAARPGVDPGWLHTRLGEALPAGIAAEGPAEEHPCWIRQHLAAMPDAAGHGERAMASLYLLPDLHEDVSATEIRSGLAAGSGLPERVLAPPVLGYILERGLYGSGPKQERRPRNSQ